jgi:hypothetical protein
MRCESVIPSTTRVNWRSPKNTSWESTSIAVQCNSGLQTKACTDGYVSVQYSRHLRAREAQLRLLNSDNGNDLSTESQSRTIVFR